MWGRGALWEEAITPAQGDTAGEPLQLASDSRHELGLLLPYASPTPDSVPRSPRNPWRCPVPDVLPGAAVVGGGG